MRPLTLVDSSAWIETLRGRSALSVDLQKQVRDLLEAKAAAMTFPIWLELYQGIKGRREESDLADLRGLCVWLEFDDACWQLAAEEARLCLRKGLTLPQSDVLVHACARRHKVRLLHCDRHFELIEKVCGA